jgi:hypothetical protein
MVENNCNNNIAESEVPNIVNTNNDKDEQNITKSKITESVEVLYWSSGMQPIFTHSA